MKQTFDIDSSALKLYKQPSKELRKQIALYSNDNFYLNTYLLEHLSEQVPKVLDAALAPIYRQNPTIFDNEKWKSWYSAAILNVFLSNQSYPKALKKVVGNARKFIKKNFHKINNARNEAIEDLKIYLKKQLNENLAESDVYTSVKDLLYYLKSGNVANANRINWPILFSYFGTPNIHFGSNELKKDSSYQNHKDKVSDLLITSSQLNGNNFFNQVRSIVDKIVGHIGGKYSSGLEYRSGVAYKFALELEKTPPGVDENWYKQAYSFVMEQFKNANRDLYRFYPHKSTTHYGNIGAEHWSTSQNGNLYFPRAKKRFKSATLGAKIAKLKFWTKKDSLPWSWALVLAKAHEHSAYLDYRIGTQAKKQNEDVQSKAEWKRLKDIAKSNQAHFYKTNSRHNGFSQMHNLKSKESSARDNHNANDYQSHR